MGRSITPKYVVNCFYRRPNGSIGCDEMIWRGCATNARAEDFRKTFNESFQPGGVNFVANAAFIPHYFKVQVRYNRPSGSVVAEANAPMFEVV